MKYLLLYGLVCLLVSCHQSPLEDQGLWRSLEPNEKAGAYMRVGNRIYGGDFSLDDTTHFSPLKNIDASTFEICEGTDYARDKKHVCYPIRIECVDANDWGGCYFLDYIVKHASPQSFIYIKDEYGVDGHQMYFRGEQIEWNDSIFDLSNRRLMSISQKKEMGKVVGKLCNITLSDNKATPSLTIVFDNGHCLNINCNWEISKDTALIMDKWSWKRDNFVGCFENLRVMSVFVDELNTISYTLEKGYNLIISPTISNENTDVNWIYVMPSEGKNYLLNGKLEIHEVLTKETKNLY